MGVRENLNNNRMVAIVVACALVVAAGLLAMKQFNRSRVVEAGKRQFITVDDGKTYVLDTTGRLPPFDVEGKLAVRARVFTSDGGKTNFVGYLERLTPAGKARIESIIFRPPASKDAAPSGPQSLLDEIIQNTEVKKPGDKNWVRQANFAESQKILAVTGPDGSQADPVEP